MRFSTTKSLQFFKFFQIYANRAHDIFLQNQFLLCSNLPFCLKTIFQSITINLRQNLKNILKTIPNISEISVFLVPRKFPNSLLVKVWILLELKYSQKSSHTVRTIFAERPIWTFPISSRDRCFFVVFYFITNRLFALNDSKVFYKSHTSGVFIGKKVFVSELCWKNIFFTPLPLNHRRNVDIRENLLVKCVSKN